MTFYATNPVISIMCSPVEKQNLGDLILKKKNTLANLQTTEERNIHGKDEPFFVATCGNGCVHLNNVKLDTAVSPLVCVFLVGMLST